MRTHLNRWIVAASVGVLAFAAIPAHAGADLAIGVTLGAPYYAPPPPRYYERTVVYEEPVYYSYHEPRVVYERHYCPRHRLYHRDGHVHAHYKHYKHRRDHRRHH